MQLLNRRRYAAYAVPTIALACAFALAASPATARITAPADAKPGASGAGDPYYPGYGNGGYDVEHYDINVTYDPGKQSLVGKTRITAKATQDLSSFNLDFLLDVKKVTVGGKAAKSSRTGRELTITPAGAMANGAAMDVIVEYSGNPLKQPTEGLTKWLKTDDGGIIGLGEPTSAPWWFPANDHPRDKATMNTTITVPKEFQAIAAGGLVKSETQGNKSIWSWSAKKPAATYTNFLAVGKFAIKQTKVGDIPIFTAITTSGDKSALELAEKDIAKTAEVNEWHSKLWGPYPFETMGAVVPAASVDFSLETQSKPVFSRIFWEMGESLFLVVHENAHQWFGDDVSVENWKDIWLNEGFATFTEAYWAETHGGQSADLWLATMVTKNKEDSAFWKTTISNPGAGKEFDISVYKRGACVLQALRRKVGDGAFFDLMKNWVQTHQYGNASVAQFREHAEKATGQDLKAFFAHWLDTPSRPAFTKENGLDNLPTPALAPGQPDTDAIIDHTHQLLHQKSNPRAHAH